MHPMCRAQHSDNAGPEDTLLSCSCRPVCFAWLHDMVCLVCQMKCVLSARASVSQESVFDLTGRTGSYFYMAPEVLHNEAYNEKVHTMSCALSQNPMQQYLSYANRAGQGLRQEPFGTHGIM